MSNVLAQRAETLWGAGALILLALFGVTLAISFFDGRQLHGAGVWAKPMKFQLSLALHFATLALLASALSAASRDSAVLRWVALVSLAATAFEVAYIMIQAGRMQASHFNLESAFHAAMYAGMAAGAVVIAVAAAIVGVALLHDPAAALGPATRLGAIIGLIGGTVLTLVIAFRMGGALTHHVGAEAAGALRLPLTGWSLTVGDRRIPHFFATHLMQAGPVAGLLADLTLPRLAAVAATVVVCAAWGATTLYLFHQANAGLPPFRWS